MAKKTHEKIHEPHKINVTNLTLDMSLIIKKIKSVLDAASPQWNTTDILMLPCYQVCLLNYKYNTIPPLMNGGVYHINIRECVAIVISQVTITMASPQ